MSRRFLGRIPVAGHKSRGNEGAAENSKQSSSEGPVVSNLKFTNYDKREKKSITSTDAKATSADHGKTNKKNLENLFETSMDISFSLSSQIHSTPVESSKYAKKAPALRSEKPSLRPVPGSSNCTSETTAMRSENNKNSPNSTVKVTPVSSPSRLTTSILTEKLQLSAWGLPEIVLQRYEEKGVTTMFEWQAECLCTPGVLEGGNLVYSAPTSAGKTIVAELLMLKRILETKQKAILILPFVSVAREKMLYLQSIFQDIGVRVGGFMGSQSPPGGLAMTDLAVCTIEKANSLCNRLIEEGNIASLGIVVVDELHLVGDPHRGYLLELLLTKLMFASRKLQHDASEEKRAKIQVVGMSATLPNLDMLARWLSAALYRTDYRPVPLYEYVNVEATIFDNDMKKVRQVLLTKSCQDDVVLSLCLETLEDNQAVLIFCPTKKWCEALSQSLAKDIYNINKLQCNQPDGKCVKLRRGQLKDVVEQLRRCPAGLDPVLSRVVPWGTAYHHAGLTMDERDIIEGAFRQGFVRILVATSTLSSGVNLPARRVIIRTPIFHGKVIDSLTYRQMIGRAGRKGVDTFGESVLVCKKTEQTKAVELVKSDLAPVKSCLARDQGLTSSMKRAILEVVVSGLAVSDKEVQSYASCTMLAASISDDTEQQSNIITDCIQFLADNEIITRRASDSAEGAESQFVATQLGSAILASSLSPDEGILVFTELQRARRCFVLENELHIIYQVTPVFMQDMWSQLDWYQYLCHWEQLGADMKRVAELVGVKESFLAKAIRGKMPMTTAAQAKTVAIHKRFYTALVLNDLVNEVSLKEVAAKYNVNKGVLQSLQQSAATFAGMVTVFCNRLGWIHLETIFSQFQSRLTFGVQRELVELVRLSVLNAQYARVLFNAEYETVAKLAHADAQHIEQLLIQATPFQSKKHNDGEHNRERHCVWLTGRAGVTEYQAAVMIIEEAQYLLQQDVALMGVKWQPPTIYAQISKSEEKYISVKVQNIPAEAARANPQEANDTVKKPDNTVFQSHSGAADLVPKLTISPKSTRENRSVAKVKPILKTPPLNRTFNRTSVAGNSSHVNLMQTPNVSILSPPAAFKCTQPYKPSVSPKVRAVAKSIDQSIILRNQTTPKLPDINATCSYKVPSGPVSPAIQAIHVKQVASIAEEVITSTPVALGTTSRLSLSKRSPSHNAQITERCISSTSKPTANSSSADVGILRDCAGETKNPPDKTEVNNLSPSLYTEEIDDLADGRDGVKGNVILEVNSFEAEEFMDSFEMDSQALAAVAMMTPSEGKTSAKEDVPAVEFGTHAKQVLPVKVPAKEESNNVLNDENNVEMEEDFLQNDGSFMDTALMHYMQQYNSQAEIAHSASPLLTSIARQRRAKESEQFDNDVHMASQEQECKNNAPVSNHNGQNTEDVCMASQEYQDIFMASPDPPGSLDDCIIDSEDLMPSSCFDREEDSSVLVDTPNANARGLKKNLTCARRLGRDGSGLEEDILNALSMSESFSWSEVQPAHFGCKPESKSKPSTMQSPLLEHRATKHKLETAITPSRVAASRVVDDFDDSLTFSMVENLVSDTRDNDGNKQPECVNEQQRQHKPTRSVYSPVDINNILEKVTESTGFKPAPKRKKQSKSTPKGKKPSQTTSGSSSKKKKRKSCDGREVNSKVRRPGSNMNEVDDEGGDFVPPTPPGLDDNVIKTRSPSRRALNLTLRKTPKRTPKRTQGKSQSKKVTTSLQLHYGSSKENHSKHLPDNQENNHGKDVGATVALSSDEYMPLSSLPPPTIPLTNQSFSIIDVTGDRNLFHHFISEWEQKESYAICLACHKLSSQGQQGGIGANFKGTEQVTPDNDGFQYPEQELLVVGLAIAWGDVDAYYITFTKNPLICDLDGSLAAGPLDENLQVEERMTAVKKVLERNQTSSNKRISKNVFALKDHYKVLANLGILLPLQGVLDPQVAEWLIDPGSAKKNLHRLVNTYLPVHSHLLEGLGGGIGVNSVGMNPENPGSGRIRACVEAVLCYHLMDQITTPLQDAGLFDAFHDVEMPVQVLLAQMEINGFGFNFEESESQRSIMQGKLCALEEQAYVLAGHYFSLTSNDDISQILFGEIGLPPSGDPSAPVKGTKTLGPARRAAGTRSGVKQTFSTAKEVLEKLSKLHPLPGVILEWRRLTTILSKVVFALAKEKIYSGGLSMYRIFCLADTHTATGRVTMTEPNLQNIPKDFDIEMPNELGESPSSSRNSFGSPGRGKGRQKWLNGGRGPVAHMRQDLSTINYTVSMRNIFIPFPGGILVAADYSQLELRMIAHLSKDKKLVNILNSGGDVFKLIAAKWKNIEPDAVSSEQRQQAKQVCYGMIYGIGPKALGEQLNVDENEAYVFIETFKAQYTGMRTFLRETVVSCRNLGYVTTILGRRRYLPAITHTKPHAKAHAERQAVNTTVQGSAADIVKKAMIDIDLALQEHFQAEVPFLQHKCAEQIDRRRSRRLAQNVAPPSAYLVLQLHDELIYETSQRRAMDIAKLIKYKMENAMEMTVHFPVKVKMGPTWGQLQDVDIM